MMLRVRKRFLRALSAQGMKRAYIYGLFAVGLISVVVIVLFVCQPSNPVKRVAKEHGIHLPASATSVRCGGDAWKRSFIDCGATVSFEMPESDLPGLVGKLSVHTSSVGTGDWVAPGNSQYVVKAPWASGSPDVVY